jgi:amino-acid N-acetyltransferase
MRIRAVTADDRAAVEELLATAGLPLEGVAENFGEFIVAEDEDTIAGVIGIERYGHTALLRSAAVIENARGAGIGSQLVKVLLDRARAQGVRDIYLLTTTAADYFPRFGFTETPRSQAPDSLRASREFQGACPATAVLMKHSLPEASGR